MSGPGAGDLPDPIVVTGAPRSGVRLLAAILDGHPALASGPELPFVTTMVQQWHDIRTSLGHNHEQHHGITPDASRAAFRTATLRLFAPRLALAGAQRFVLQTFSAAILLEQFAALFPTARFVLMIRDPRDIVPSLLRCDWRDPRDGKSLPYTRDPAVAAQFLLGFMNSVLQNAQTLQAAGRLMPLHYEQLCADPHGTMDRLGSFLPERPPQPRVSKDSAMLVTESHDNPHPPLRIGAVDSLSSVGRRNAGTAPDLDPVQAAINRLRRTLGYRST